MDKRIKISLAVLGVLALVGGGLLIYFRRDLYKEKSVREDEKKFKDFGSILQAAEKKHPDVLMWYNDLPQSNITLIEESYQKLTPEQQRLIIEGFKKPDLNDFTKKVLSRMNYKKQA